MPSTRMQKAKEKRSRQSDVMSVMSDIESLDVMLGSYQRDNSEAQDRTSDNETDLESNRRENSSNQNENDYRSYLTLVNYTNFSENSGITVKTSRAISSDISSQKSKKFEEMQTNLSSQILDVINAAIETKLLPSKKNAVKSQNSVKNTNLDLQSDGPHPSYFGQVRPQKDLQSHRLHPENASYAAGDAHNDFPRLVSMRSDRINHCREKSLDSNHSDDENGYDMVTGANLTPQMVPEFLTGRPMQPRNKTPHQQRVDDDTLNTTIPAQMPPVPTNNRDVSSETPSDPINILADVIMGMNNKPSAQTLMVRPH